mmetsp:Transcript_4079/g.7436  ORF Transcript_4079/g.7436 Transcript_4079/m.7436 type:complete len:200 (+) Transcript_4079:508-1107(+)
MDSAATGSPRRWSFSATAFPLRPKRSRNDGSAAPWFMRRHPAACTRRLLLWDSPRTWARSRTTSQALPLVSKAFARSGASFSTISARSSSPGPTRRSSAECLDSTDHTLATHSSPAPRGHPAARNACASARERATGASEGVGSLLSMIRTSKISLSLSCRARGDCEVSNHPNPAPASGSMNLTRTSASPGSVETPRALQ